MSTGFSSIEIFAAAGLVLLSAGLSLAINLGIHRAMLIAALRMAIQLVLVGLLLRAIFASNSPWLTLGLLAIMITAASYEVGARQQRRLRGIWNFLVSGAAVSSATVLVAMFALASLASSSPDWASPQVAIPIAGIILGTAMSAGSVGLAALFNSVSAERNGIEARLALGHTRRQALNPLLRRAVHTGTIPVINQMAGAGIITLPGIMSGQVLAGQDPLVAAQSQIFLMFLLCAASVCSVVIVVSLTLRRLTDDRHRLRLDRLEAMRS